LGWQLQLDCLAPFGRDAPSRDCGIGRIDIASFNGNLVDKEAQRGFSLIGEFGTIHMLLNGVIQIGHLCDASMSKDRTQSNSDLLITREASFSTSAKMRRLHTKLLLI